MKDESGIREAVQSVVQSIYDQKGEASASDLLQAATPKESPAHDAFEWDNKKAGHEYRLIQARKWLRVVVVRTEAPEPERLVHVPVRVSREGASPEGAYKPISVVQENPDEFERAMDEAMSRLRAARNAVESLRAAAEKGGSPDRIAMVAQISRGLEIMQQAIQSVH